MNTQEKIDKLFDNFKAFLKEKNIRYGDSALAPMQVFCKESAELQIRVRLDDKLNRIKNSKEVRKNDYSDLFGYLALYMLVNDWITFDEFLD